MVELDTIATEQQNISSTRIDSVSTLELVQIMNSEDQKVALAVQALLPSIAKAIDIIAAQLQQGGRLFYIGSGTSGRLGILDAAECPPTYSTPPDLVQGIIAGGHEAIFRAKEGAEDSAELGITDIKSHHITVRDIVVGLSASGRTPYVVGALTYAKKQGAAAIAVVCSPDSPAGACADIELCARTGPEVITGSTRLKAGTAQKMILNMLSTGAMIKLGKVYGNLMVDVKASNQKLKARAQHIVMKAAGCTAETADAALASCQGSAKTAIVMIRLHISADKAAALLAKSHGYIAKALQEEYYGL